MLFKRKTEKMSIVKICLFRENKSSMVCWIN